MTATIFGCTGAVGSQILATALASKDFSTVQTISRRLPNEESSKLQALSESDTSKWSDMITTLAPKPSVVFNAVGTTTAAAGGIKNQWKIDHDLCVENARAAKEAGVKTYVYISSGGTRSLLWGWVPYSKMKVGVEDAIKELAFENAVVLRPGMIIGRETSKALVLERFVEGLRKLGQGVQDKVGMQMSTFLSLVSCY